MGSEHRHEDCRQLKDRLETLASKNKFIVPGMSLKEIANQLASAQVSYDQSTSEFYIKNLSFVLLNAIQAYYQKKFIPMSVYSQPLQVSIAAKTAEQIYAPKKKKVNGQLNQNTPPQSPKATARPASPAAVSVDSGVDFSFLPDIGQLEQQNNRPRADSRGSHDFAYSSSSSDLSNILPDIEPRAVGSTTATVNKTLRQHSLSSESKNSSISTGSAVTGLPTKLHAKQKARQFASIVQPRSTASVNQVSDKENFLNNLKDTVNAAQWNTKGWTLFGSKVPRHIERLRKVFKRHENIKNNKGGLIAEFDKTINSTILTDVKNILTDATKATPWKRSQEVAQLYQNQYILFQKVCSKKPGVQEPHSFSILKG